MKKLLVWGLVLCLMAGLLCAGAAAAPAADGVEDAVVMVEFCFGEDRQVTLGLVVGEVGQPSRYVILDDYYYTDETGVNEADTVVVYTLSDYQEYKVVGVKKNQGSRLIVLETETEIQGSAAMTFSAENEYAIDATVYSAELMLAGDDKGEFKLRQGKVIANEPRGNYYAEPMLQISLEEVEAGGGVNVVLGESGAVAAFNYDYDADTKIQSAFAANVLMTALDTYCIPYTVTTKAAGFGVMFQAVSGTSEESTEQSTEETIEETTEAEATETVEPAQAEETEPAAETVAEEQAEDAAETAVETPAETAEEAPAQGTAVVWNDPRFGQLVEEAMGHAPTVEELAQVQVLVLLGDEITVDGEAPASMSQSETGSVTSLADLAYFPGLKTLWINSQPVSDISAVANCTQLEFLSLCYNEISDLAPLGNLTQLEQLYLYGNEIADISPLAGLTKLDSLGLGQNMISDLSPLSGLKKLTFLRVHNNNVSDLTPLAGMYQLEDLVITGNLVSDLTPLGALSRLSLLRASDNMITDVTPLSGLVRLEELQLADNAITDASPLTKLVKLSYLDITGNPVNDVSGLAFVDELYHD